MDLRRLPAVLALMAAAVPISGFAQSPGQNQEAPAQEKAQTPDYSKEAFLIEEYISRTRYEASGTSRTETQVRVKVQSDAGVQQLGEITLGYSSANQKLTIDLVKVTKKDGSEVTAAADAVKDLSSPISREAPMYTDFRQKHVTVPSLQPGETLEYKFTLITDPPLAPGHFWTEYNFERDAIVLNERLEINVPRNIPVKLKTHPGLEPQVSEEADRRIYRWSSSNKQRLTEEEQKKRDERERRERRGPAIQLTTFQSWAEIGQWYGSYEKERIVPTPEIRAKAAELTKGRNSDLEKIEALYDFVAKNFRYVSLSFGVGRFQPHAAAEVLSNQYGDCKDKHTLLASLLAATGVRSSAVLIPSQRKLDGDVPSPSQFDHVITLAFASGAAKPEDALVWLDTTTEVAPFRLLSANLRGKQALVVMRHALPSESRVAGPELAETPPDPPFLSKQDADVDAKVSELGKLTARVRYTLRGDAELGLRWAFRRTPQNQWKDLAQRMAYGDGFLAEVTDVKVGDPAATAEPFRMEYEITQPNFIDWSSKKSTINLPMPNMGLPSAGAEPKEGGEDKIELGSPLEANSRLKLELPEKYATRTPVGIGVKRDYAEYRSSYKLEKNVLTAERSLRLQIREVPGTQRMSYVAFQRAVRTDESQQLQVESTVAGTPSIPDSAKPEELMQTGLAALNNDNFAAAVALFKKVLELEPKHKNAWNELGRAHLAQRQYEEAATAFRKQMEVNAFDENAYKNLGLTLWQQQKFNEAIEAFKKQIEINPLDRSAHSSLGMILREQKRYEEAVPVLEKAISLTPNNALLHVGLGQALLSLNQPEKAMEAFDKAVELAPAPTVWNNIAYELTLKNIHLDRAQQYAESAVAATAARLRNLQLDTVTLQEMALVQSIAAYWDTLGWVHFQRGSLEKAEAYVRASWALNQHGEVGDHLGQIYEKQGRKQDALRTYAQALAATRPPAETRGRLVKLVGSEEYATQTRLQAGEELAATRTVKLEKPLKESANADFFILIGPDGKAVEVKFLSGSEKLRVFAESLRAAKYPVVFPDETPTKLVRRGMLSCSPATGNCVFVLLNADDVTSVN